MASIFGVDRTSADSLIHSPSIETYYNQNFRSHGPLPDIQLQKSQRLYPECGC